MIHLRILEAVSGTPWAIHPEKGRQIIDFLLSLEGGANITNADRIAAKAMASGKESQPSQQQSVGILPISSVIVPRAHDITDSSLGSSGGQSAEVIGRDFDMMMNDSKVGAIILDIDSPGGSVAGITELFNKIYSARGSKPILAIANHMCASAAYWIGCAADEFIMTPSAMVGSVGVYSYHDDISDFMKTKGVKRTYISSSSEKVEDASEFALSEKAKGHLQAVIDTYAAQFIRDVALGRNKSEVDVRKNFGNGRMYQKETALANGMVDRVATMETIISELSARITNQSQMMANRRRRLELTG